MIYWSADDAAFIAEVPELSGCTADGTTYQEALSNVEIVIEEWIQTAKEWVVLFPCLKGECLLCKFPAKQETQPPLAARLRFEYTHKHKWNI